MHTWNSVSPKKAQLLEAEHLTSTCMYWASSRHIQHLFAQGEVKVPSWSFIDKRSAASGGRYRDGAPSLMQGPTIFDKTPQRSTKQDVYGDCCAMSGTESLVDVTLRPWPASKKDELSPQDLLHQIEQLTSERGHLRNVTEKSLQEDVVAGKELPEDTEGDSEEKTDKKDKKDAPTKEERLQEVIRMHQEMSSHME
jgi:hypothetical protein